MTRPRLLSAAIFVAAIGVFASCSDQTPVGPEAALPAPQAHLFGSLDDRSGKRGGDDSDGPIGSLLRNTGLLSCTPLPYASATQTIGPAGGVIHVGPHKLTVPAGALREPVTIKADAPSSRVNLVRFKPEGLKFRRNASLTMSYANCSLLQRLLPKRIAYVGDDLRIYYYLLSLDILDLREVTGRLDHFSGYAIAW